MPRSHQRLWFCSAGPRGLGSALPSIGKVMSFVIGHTIAGKYRIERVLGQGGMGTVYRAQHLLLDRAVAIKILRSDTAEPSLGSERLLREGRALARLRGQHIARVLDVEVDASGECFLVLEYLEGEDLGSVLERQGPFPVAQAVSYVLEVCEALAEAHRLGIVHRDIKPSNLFLTTLEDGSLGIKVIDFGISKHSQPSTTITQSRSMLGSPCYMAPEQMRSSGTVDARSDVWSLGVVLYELLIGVPPHSGASVLEICADILESPPKSPKALRAEVPDIVDGVVRKCMARDPAQRFADVTELARVLARYSATGSDRLGWFLPNHSAQQLDAPSLAEPVRATDTGTRTARATTSLAPPHRRSLRPWLLGAFSAAVFLLVGILGVLRRSKLEMHPSPTTQESSALDTSNEPSPRIVLPSVMPADQGEGHTAQLERETAPRAVEPVLPVRSRRAPVSASGAPGLTSLPGANVSEPTTAQTAAPVHSTVAPGNLPDPVLQYGRF